MDISNDENPLSTQSSSPSSHGSEDLANEIPEDFKIAGKLDDSKLKLVEAKLEKYFENSLRTEIDPLSNAIETAIIASSLKKALLMHPILDYVEAMKRKEGEGSPAMIEMKQFLHEIHQIQRSSVLELEQYCRVIVTPSNMEEELSEFRKEYNSAVEQIHSQMKASDERRLEGAILTMNSLETDEFKGGYSRLLSLIEIGAKCSEEAVESLKSRLTTSRAEFISLRHSDVLLEKSAQISYEKIRDAYAHLLRLSHKRANANDLQWIELETKGREKMMNEMKSILNGYRSTSSSSHLPHGTSSDHSERINQHRLVASRRLQRFGDKLVSTSISKTEAREKYSESLLQSKKLAVAAWKNKQAELMNDWLCTTEKEIGTCYLDSLQQLHDKISEIRSDIHTLDLHAKKLAHLRRISMTNYQAIRDKSVVEKSRGSFRPSNGKLKEIKRESPDETRIPPSISMNIGSRVWGLCRAVGVDYEESVVLMTQLLHIVHPDPLMMQRLSHFVSHYDSILSKRKS